MRCQRTRRRTAHPLCLIWQGPAAPADAPFAGLHSCPPMPGLPHPSVYVCEVMLCTARHMNTTGRKAHRCAHPLRGRMRSANTPSNWLGVAVFLAAGSCVVVACGVCCHPGCSLPVSPPVQVDASARYSPPEEGIDAHQTGPTNNPSTIAHCSLLPCVHGPLGNGARAGANNSDTCKSCANANDDKNCRSHLTPRCHHVYEDTAEPLPNGGLVGAPEPCQGNQTTKPWQEDTGLADQHATLSMAAHHTTAHLTHPLQTKKEPAGPAKKSRCATIASMSRSFTHPMG